ncbi:programmed cell death protein 2 [Kickxella alabastrina]|uniref:programmed cell death protein 2 n=1 Tax=Kickxella alabastrina TaxID=61397 RepID=UPI00221FE559|nr:programmed cell death protein 2 [Kickxella alabastrina]KAI7833054.1 programmed cell death protein 2 [Kickxella alabastrina]
MVVTLGYAEAVDEEFGREVFSSKIGGKPRWLDPTRPLAVNRVVCDECTKPMVLLMQLYAPEDEPASAFHRTLYVFICRSGACHKAGAKQCMRVFRSQLAEENSVYEEDASSNDVSDNNDDDDDITWALRPQVKAAPLCVVCGLAGTKGCSKCRARLYCSRDHQLADWSGGHREQCGSGKTDNAAHRRKLQRMVFPEYVIVSEEEPAQAQAEAEAFGEDSDDDGEDTEGITAEDMALVPVSGERAEDSSVDVDRAFLMFQRRIQLSPDQVIRYARSAESPGPSEPLFVSDDGRPSIGADANADVPACEKCSAAREFELQIMPQMLNFLSIDSVDPASIDWGTLLIYTCPKSCDSAGYAGEVICRQNFSSQGIGEKFMRAMHGDDSGFTKQFDSLNI